MNICIIGLGYVGCVGTGCLAELGHNIIGVDISDTKVNLINNGKATIVENDIDDLIKKNRDNKRISATTSIDDGVKESDVAIICVGTPNNSNGHLSMETIYKVAKEIGNSLKYKNSFYTIAIRSTVMPGTNQSVSEIIEKESGKKMNSDFAVVSNPEFLREGCAVEDFFNPPYTVIASQSKKACQMMSEVYSEINAEIINSSIGSAELLKFVNNSFHALKVVFGNEVGRICKKLNVDSRELMDVFVKDQILNISPYYLKPGFAYGGSCLPKDLKALNSISHDQYLETPLLESVSESNYIHIEHALNLIINKNKKNIGFWSITFKSGTDDLRNSPALELVERLLGKGYNVKIYDKNVNLSNLMGKNREFLFNKLPHISKILVDSSSDLLKDLDVLVIANIDKELNNLELEESIDIVDFLGVEKICKKNSSYDGICW